MSSDDNLNELQQFAYKLAIPSAVSLFFNLFISTTFGLIISVIVHIIVLGVYMLLFKQFKSAFLKLILAGLIACVIGEVLIFFNLEHIKYQNVYWAFLLFHFGRNVVLGSAFAWNAIKSHIYNSIWIKLIPFVVIIPVFLLLQILLFDQEEKEHYLFIGYNVSLCFMLMTSWLRYNHSSDKSFIVMILAMLSFVVSEIFYFWEFQPDQGESIITAFRTPFLQLGSCLMVAATIDHVIHFKLTVKQRIYLPMAEIEHVMKGRATAGVKKTKKAVEEPLI